MAQIFDTYLSSYIECGRGGDLRTSRVGMNSWLTSRVRMCRRLEEQQLVDGHRRILEQFAGIEEPPPAPELSAADKAKEKKAKEKAAKEAKNLPPPLPVARVSLFFF